MAKETMLPQLKAGSIINIQLGSAFIAKIQECFHQHCTGHQEDMDKVKARNGDYETVPLSPWENQAVLYSSLLQAIMKQAEKDGVIEYVSLEEAMKGMMPAMSTPSGPKEDSDQH